MRTILAALFAALAVPAAWASPITVEGVVFSPGSDNLRLLSVSGTGRLDDPFTVVEEVTGQGEVILNIEVLEAEFGSRIHTIHATGFALTKVVRNATDAPWDYFSLELEFTHGYGSDYFDGLSFAQASQANRPFRSDRFSRVDDIQEPRDVVRFTEGQVRPGEQASFSVAVTYTGLRPNFSVVQNVLRPFAGLPETDRRVLAAAASSPASRRTPLPPATRQP